MIKFELVRYKNILSTGNAFTEVRLDKHPSTLIVGTNGAGKSTMIDALCFALFGKPYRKINKPQLINSINQKDLVVEVEFSIGKSKYKVVRGIKPNKFEIWQNGTMLNQDASARDYQSLLEKQILKLNFKSFTQIVVLGSASFTPFMQLSANDRREIIEDLLDIQIFSVMNDILKGEMQSTIQRSNQLKSDMDMTKQKVELQESYISKIEEARKKGVQDIQEKIQQATTAIGEYSATITTLREKIEGREQTIADLDAVSKKLSKLTKLQSQLESNVNKFQKEIKFYDESESCHTCKQEIADTFKDKIIEEKGEKLRETTSALTELESQIEIINKRLKEINEVQLEISDLQHEVSKYQAMISTQNTHIDSLNVELEKVQQASSDDTSEDRKALKELAKQYLDMTEEKSKINEDKYYYEIGANLLKDGGIKTKIINQYLPVINHYVNQYLKSMDFFVQFELDENFKETIRSRHRDAFSYASFSEGEKMRIDLSLLFTWRQIAKMKNSTNTNLLIMDEVFDSSLDTTGTDEFLKILNTLDKGVNSFIISHKGDTLFDKFTNIIRFDKFQNYSRMVS
jgi:DNA repair exonuclease SbcCD ATPase subunit